MNHQNLRKQLEQLHDEIEKTDRVDDEGRRLLRDLDTHIRDLLERSQTGDVKPEPGFTAGLETAIRHFEVSHPDLTSALSDFLTALSNAGI
jgi:hypothetical protein